MARSPERRQHTIKARVKEFGIPPIHDALVLGRQSPIGCAAMRKAIDLLVATPFEHIELDDPVVNDILIRASILRRMPKEKVIAYVLSQLKPMMTAEEVLHVDFDIEIALETETL